MHICICPRLHTQAAKSGLHFPYKTFFFLRTLNWKWQPRKALNMEQEQIAMAPTSRGQMQALKRFFYCKDSRRPCWGAGSPLRSETPILSRNAASSLTAFHTLPGPGAPRLSSAPPQRGAVSRDFSEALVLYRDQMTRPVKRAAWF